MDWLNRLNEAIQYIEKHLEDEIDIDYAAHLACCSTFHFHRMFSYITDTSISEYIRRRKMSKAAMELQNNKTKIIDIALKYGYESPTAFNRAFQSIHGIAPSKARLKGVVLKSYPAISFKITIKGDVEMNYRIENKDAFKIVGVKQHYTGGIEESFVKAPLFWQKTKESNIIPSLCSMMNTDIKGILSVSSCSANKEFDYYIAVATTKDTPQAMSELVIPPTTWAIFECIGKMPMAIQNLQKRINSEWLPSSEYKYANSPDIELYFEGDVNSDNYKCEVWIPIIK